MGMRPRESNAPIYDLPDGFVKFFMYGGNAEIIPDHIRIFNKVGWAYGYLTDVAYIVDFENKIEFMVAATIHVNENEIYNDDQYEYQKVGIHQLLMVPCLLGTFMLGPVGFLLFIAIKTIKSNKS